MTKKEKIIVQKAINELIADNGDFSGAVANLCRLVGWRHPAGEIPKNLPTITVDEYLRTHKGNHKFKAPKK
jgi:hypothetical protein